MLGEKEGEWIAERDAKIPAIREAAQQRHKRLFPVIESKSLEQGYWKVKKQSQ
jgi:hypothetical protein